MNIKNPDGRSNLAKQEINWIKEFTNVCEGNAPDFKWFKEGKLNISENCLDRHITNENDAIIHISEENKKQVISYKELYQKVNNFSFALKSLDIKKGSRVIIYMPTIPESIIAMLSCARLGLIHSVVFAGFSSDSLIIRIIVWEAELVISVDSGRRNGQMIMSKNS